MTRSNTLPGRDTAAEPTALTTDTPGPVSPPPSGRATTAAPRFHELDALRAVAMLLGIVLHTAIFFVPDA